MAPFGLLLGPLLPAPLHHRRILRNRCQGRIVASNAANPVKDGGAAAVVWFKHDLRIDDHPGLAAAVSEPRPVVPLYVFDQRILAGYSDKMLELLLFALKDLKMALKSQDSDLLIGLGNAEDVLLKLVNEVQAGLIFTEEEVEYRVRDVLANVESSLSNGSFSWGSPPKIVAWSAPLYDYKNLAAVSASHDEFLKKKLPSATPLAAATLPALNVELDTDSRCLEMDPRLWVVHALRSFWRSHKPAKSDLQNVISPELQKQAWRSFSKKPASVKAPRTDKPRSRSEGMSIKLIDTGYEGLDLGC